MVEAANGTTIIRPKRTWAGQSVTLKININNRKNVSNVGFGRGS